MRRGARVGFGVELVCPGAGVPAFRLLVFC
ncbi:protein of unknown function [Cupriavidus taiwanensis]|nr:protein of unknown function [Cupriavidus taiwanensis]